MCCYYSNLKRYMILKEGLSCLYIEVSQSALKKPVEQVASNRNEFKLCVQTKETKTFHGTKDNNFTISYFGWFSLAKIAFMIECISCVVFKDCCRSSQFWQHIIYYLTKHGNTFVCIVQLNVQIIGRRLFIALNKCECLLVLML